MKTNPIIILLLITFLFSLESRAGSFRCGTKIVVTGDSVSRLMKSCGAPVLKYKAKETIRSGSGRQDTSVTQWIYERGRKKNMVVSVRSGKVVKIAVD